MTTLDLGVLDASAVFAILENEAAGSKFLDGLERCNRLTIGASTLAELSMVVRIKKGPSALTLLDDFLTLLGVEALPFDDTQITRFREGLEKYGKGIHPAGLNFGDLFAYSLAKSLNAPLFFQGLDFRKTDVKNAMALLGHDFSAAGEPV